MNARLASLPILCITLLLPAASCQDVVVGNSFDASDLPDSDAALAGVVDLVDGDWQSIEPFTNQDFRAVDIQGPLLVAVGNFGMVYTSPDGQTWTKRYEDLDTDLLAVAHSASGYAAVGKNGTIVHSSDGVTWTASSGLATERLRTVSPFGDGFIALGTEMLTSIDGTTWVNHGPSPEEFTSVIEVDQILYAVAFEDEFQATIYTSTDGFAWTAHETAMSEIRSLNSLAECNGRFVAVGEQGTVLTSLDGQAWTIGDSGTSMHFESVTCTDTGFAIVGRFSGDPGDPLFEAGALLTSVDALTWNVKIGQDASKRLYGIDAHEARAVAVGNDGTIFVNTLAVSR